jgi:hypothetical protein
MMAKHVKGCFTNTCPMEGWNSYETIINKEVKQSIRTSKFVEHQHKKIITHIKLNTHRLLKQN